LIFKSKYSNLCSRRGKTSLEHLTDTDSSAKGDFMIKQILALAICIASISAFAGPETHTASIDRFSDKAAHLFKRSSNSILPAPNAPINFDQGAFITQGFAPNGDYVGYYNFDVQPTAPAPIYVFFKAGASSPIAEQMNIVGVIPGDAGYNDFWNVVKVTVPDEYVANSIKSVEELVASGYSTQSTPILVNCPIVPAGSTASQRYNGNSDTGLHMGWYKDMAISYFNFSERMLSLTNSGAVPLSPIYVTFNKNPDAMDSSSGPASGFVTDMKTGRTHNVVQTVPEQARYSPLWSVSVFDNRAFASVHDLASVQKAPILADGVATVNCPVVSRSAAPSVQ
jgi:hypothetical protein